ncbi:hypothetical protein PENTCL1PPCAC_10279, partial [Pristionchus entomophagus]
AELVLTDEEDDSFEKIDPQVVLDDSEEDKDRIVFLESELAMANSRLKQEEDKSRFFKKGFLALSAFGAIAPILVFVFLANGLGCPNHLQPSCEDYLTHESCPLSVPPAHLSVKMREACLRKYTEQLAIPLPNRESNRDPNEEMERLKKENKELEYSSHNYMGMEKLEKKIRGMEREYKRIERTMSDAMKVAFPNSDDIVERAFLNYLANVSATSKEDATQERQKFNSDEKLGKHQTPLSKHENFPICSTIIYAGVAIFLILPVYLIRPCKKHQVQEDNATQIDDQCDEESEKDIVQKKGNDITSQRLEDRLQLRDARKKMLRIVRLIKARKSPKKHIVEDQPREKEVTASHGKSKNACEGRQKTLVDFFPKKIEVKK